MENIMETFFWKTEEYVKENKDQLLAYCLE